MRPRQVHGAAVAEVGAGGALDRAEADAVLSTVPDIPVAILTADCVPILAALADGSAVVAIHAGWRGLAAGVIGAGIERLAARTARPRSDIVAVIGPRIGVCCYEVDAPVLGALRHRFGEAVERVARRARPGHHWLDLGGLAAEALTVAGLDPSRLAVLEDACTRCDPGRFHSYRRDGDRAGRMEHYIMPCSFGA
jgi:hypothetical protein